MGSGKLNIKQLLHSYCNIEICLLILLRAWQNSAFFIHEGVGLMNNSMKKLTYFMITHDFNSSEDFAALPP